ncbi:RNA polymerase sigma factor [Teredinibacter waterburyi]|jgi:RNA polymerase sigma factor, sigma-70 family|uniref:RNA polymerase sigma factor n=1 Tax=Teredinibacter waterburyi TaxID=1500538 RepID=UPI00165EEB10|nr:RNA polymerase sigma factor [Teredinibacter waterburyi]
MKEALTELLPSLRRFAYSLTGQMADADDLLQSTVEKLLSKPVPADVPLAAWAFRVCRNLWIDDYRARKVRLSAAQSPELTDYQIVDGTRAMEQKVALEQVNQAMDKLPDDHRSILALVCLQGLSYKAVAEVLEIPTGTVMSRLARARIALAESLKPQNLNPARTPL